MTGGRGRGGIVAGAALLIALGFAASGRAGDAVDGSPVRPAVNAPAPGSTVLEAGVAAAGTILVEPAPLPPPPRPAIAGGWILPPDGGCARIPFTVQLRLTNTGDGEAAEVFAELVASGTAGATVVDAPAPVTGLAPGASVTLDWRLVTPGAGSVRVAAFVRGVDATGTAFEVAGNLESGDLVLVEPGALAVSVAVRPEASVGQWIPVAVTITNTGGVRADRVVPVLSGPVGPGRFRTMPPPVPNLSIGPGDALRLHWTWSVSGAGAHAFTASVFADTCAGGIPLGAAALASLVAVPPARLAGAIAVSSSRIVSGQRLEVVFTLTNEGGAAATGLTVPLPTPSTSRAKLASGPMRGTLAILPAGSATRMTWGWTMLSVGPAWFTGRATARDANADWAIGTGLVDSGRVRMLAPAKVKAEQFTLFPEPRVRVGGYVTASLVLTNTGESTALLTDLEIREVTTPGGLLTQKSLVSPGLPMEIPGGDSRSVVWTYRTDAKGTAGLEAKARLQEAATARALAEVKAISNRIAATGFISP